MYKTSIEMIGNAKEHATLYEACKRIVRIEGGNVTCPGRRKAFEGSPLVAFWDGWRHKVSAGYGATDIEREAIEDYNLR